LVSEIKSIEVSDVKTIDQKGRVRQLLEKQFEEKRQSYSEILEEVSRTTSYSGE